MITNEYSRSVEQTDTSSAGGYYSTTKPVPLYPIYKRPAGIVTLIIGGLFGFIGTLMIGVFNWFITLLEAS